jgi:hypothetical protein
MRGITNQQTRLELQNAFRLMTDALDILDDLHAPGVIGSTLDLAIVRLAEVLGRSDHEENGLETLNSQLERELSTGPISSEPKPSPWGIPPR